MKKLQQGFTLIELLVVIAIIAILAAILFPVLSNARKSAWVSGCTSNMKQFMNAVTLYRDDYNGFLPQANNIWFIDYNKPATLSYNYFDELFPYMKTANVAICPAKPILAIKNSLVNLWYYQGQPTRWYGAVYTPSMWPWKKGQDGPRRMAHMIWSQGKNLVNPDTVDYWTKYNCRRTEAIMLFCMSGTWSITWDDARIRQMFPDKIAHGSHERGTPALFADGHVKFVDYDRVGNL
ncbi:MAG: type II secretion system protein [Armatimonadota bacterium]